MKKLLSRAGSKVGWLALCNIGTPVTDPRWTWGNQKFPIFNDYQAARVVHSADGKCYKLL